MTIFSPLYYNINNVWSLSEKEKEEMVKKREEMKKKKKKKKPTSKKREASQKHKRNRHKTQLCTNYLYIGYCPYGKSCTYAHGKEELRELSEQLEKSSSSPNNEEQ